MPTTERELVTLEKVSEISPIEGADAIERLKIRGWDVVSQKGNFEVGDDCLFFEIDSALPLDDERFQFLEPRGSKTIEDKEYHVLRTAKLRGVYSQGLALPVTLFTPLELEDPDITSALGVVKYEPPLPTGMNVVGPFPRHLGGKTDAERVQNLGDMWEEIREHMWYPTEKIDGTSVSIFQDEDGDVHVCSRNWELEDGNDLYWRTVKNSGVLDHLYANMSIRAEIYGEGIQGNPLGVKGVHLAVFDYTDDGFSLPRSQWPDFEVAPVLTLPFPDTIEAAVEQVNGMKSTVTPERQAEGVVWWNASNSVTHEVPVRNFKAINNKYLLKHGG